MVMLHTQLKICTEEIRTLIHLIGLMLRVLVEGKISIHLIRTTFDELVKNDGVNTVQLESFYNSYRRTVSKSINTQWITEKLRVT